MRLSITITLMAITQMLFAQTADTTRTDSLINIDFLQNVVIEATRAGENNPTAYSEVSEEEIEEINLGQDLPILLDQQPSIVTTSDAGNGVGYTGLRIRGSDQSRINVTINGIPYNDAESQGVFWVNMPDLASSVSNIQIQRGLGASTNGAGAFGGTVNVQTEDPAKEAFGQISASYGSFNTWKTTLEFGSGLIGDKIAFQGRVSKIASDGYIDRATSDLKSYFLSSIIYTKRDIFRFNVFGGKEITYQSWNGVDEATLETDRTFNSAGTDYGAKSGDPYDNEVDNYRQDHYQVIHSRQLSPYLYENTALHYTRGYGYFEQYKVSEDLADYNLSDVVIGGDTITSTDLIRRRWLDNHFYGATYSLIYERSNWGFTFGGGWNQYRGDHFGEIIWAEYASDSEYEQQYYFNDGRKNDLNTYIKLNWRPTEKLNLFVDMQYRNVMHQLSGIDNDQRYIELDTSLHFFNPKAGLSYQIAPAHQLYTFFGMGHREPTRNDYIDAPTGISPSPERMYNLELGYKFSKEKYRFTANYYLMYYKDQLVLTGELNDVGSPVRTNVDQSYRTGIELVLALMPIKQLQINLNATYSANRIMNFTEVLYVYDENYNFIEAEEINYSNTPISFSPDIIMGASLAYKPVKGLEFELYNKFVGRQYLDNTGDESRSLDPYYVANFRAAYTLSTLKFPKEITFSLLVNNLFNNTYESNGYTFGEIYEVAGDRTRADYNYYYPQAGINLLGGITIKF